MTPTTGWGLLRRSLTRRAVESLDEPYCRDNSALIYCSLPQKPDTYTFYGAQGDG
jgi:hypothetical protein